MVPFDSQRRWRPRAGRTGQTQGVDAGRVAERAAGRCLTWLSSEAVGGGSGRKLDLGTRLAVVMKEMSNRALPSFPLDQQQTTVGLVP